MPFSVRLSYSGSSRNLLSGNNSFSIVLAQSCLIMLTSLAVKRLLPLTVPVLAHQCLHDGSRPWLPAARQPASFYSSDATLHRKPVAAPPWMVRNHYAHCMDDEEAHGSMDDDPPATSSPEAAPEAAPAAAPEAAPAGGPAAAPVAAPPAVAAVAAAAAVPAVAPAVAAVRPAATLLGGSRELAGVDPKDLAITHDSVDGQVVDSTPEEHVWDGYDTLYAIDRKWMYVWVPKAELGAAVKEAARCATALRKSIGEGTPDHVLAKWHNELAIYDRVSKCDTVTDWAQHWLDLIQAWKNRSKVSTFATVVLDYYLVMTPTHCKGVLAFSSVLKNITKDCFKPATVYSIPGIGPHPYSSAQLIKLMRHLHSLNGTHAGTLTLAIRDGDKKLSKGEAIALINEEALKLFADGRTTQALEYYYKRMIKFDPAIDDEWRFRDGKTAMVEKWKTAATASEMFTPDTIVCKIKSLDDMDPWQRYIWDKAHDEEFIAQGFLLWIWCATNQSGKDELLKYMMQHYKGGILTLKKPTSTDRLVNLCKSRGRFKLLAVNVGKQDSKTLFEHCDFFEEISNYGAMSASDMFAGRTHVYTHKVSMVTCNAKPPPGIEGRRVLAMGLPAATKEEEKDVKRTAYRLRLKTWQGYEFEPILEHLAAMEVDAVDDEPAPDVKSKKHGQVLVQRLWDEKLALEAAAAAERARCKKASRQDVLMHLTPNTKKRTADQLGWETPSAADEQAWRQERADSMAGLSPNTLKAASKQLHLKLDEEDTQDDA